MLGALADAILKGYVCMPTNDEFKEVLRQLNARSIRNFAQSLPWPYNGMVNDITGAIQTRGNYLAALGLACYTEVCGRQIIFNGDNDEKDWRCFNEFLRYIGLKELLDKEIVFEGRQLFFKDAVRNGLVHRYFMKVKDGSVKMISTNKDANRLGFLITNQDQLAMVVVPYFRLFCAGLQKAKDEDKLKWRQY